MLKKTDDGFYLGSRPRDRGEEDCAEAPSSPKPLLRRAAGRVFVPAGR